MNRILSIFAVLAFAVMSFGAHTKDVALDANYTWDEDSILAFADSIHSTTDSVIVLNKFKPKEGYTYFLVNAAITGTNAANAEYRVYLYNQTSNGTTQEQVELDTISAAGANQVFLPFALYPGYSYKLVFRAGGANGAVTVLNKCYLYKRRNILRTELRSR